MESAYVDLQEHISKIKIVGRFRSESELTLILKRQGKTIANHKITSSEKIW
jgi:hypothetical protein